MSALLPDGFVQGRLPHGWRIAARIVYETGVIEITSPDTERFEEKDAMAKKKKK